VPPAIDRCYRNLEELRELLDGEEFVIVVLQASAPPPNLVGSRSRPSRRVSSWARRPAVPSSQLSGRIRRPALVPKTSIVRSHTTIGKGGPTQPSTAVRSSRRALCDRVRLNRLRRFASSRFVCAHKMRADPYAPCLSRRERDVVRTDDRPLMKATARVRRAMAEVVGERPLGEAFIA
jgi:hypothetical protein